VTLLLLGERERVRKYNYRGNGENFAKLKEL
jgi:hypothetical protein